MKASLFITCLADLFFPQVGESVYRLLRRLGVELDFPPGQTCCGQPAYNAGFHREAEAAAAQLVRAFRHSEYVVTPSGSCAAMIREYYPRLFEGHPLAAEARALAGRVYEFSQFLVGVLGVEDVGARWQGRAVYHDSCHMSRGLGVVAEPRALLSHVEGLELVEMERPDLCCGFGGTFAVKLPEISEAMADEKLQHAMATGADLLVGVDCSCLMHLEGRLHRCGQALKVMHLAVLLDQAVRTRA